MGWVFGPIVLAGFAGVTYYTAALLTQAYRTSNDPTGRRLVFRACVTRGHIYMGIFTYCKFAQHAFTQTGWNFATTFIVCNRSLAQDCLWVSSPICLSLDWKETCTCAALISWCPSLTKFLMQANVTTPTWWQSTPILVSLQAVWYTKSATLIWGADESMAAIERAQKWWSHQLVP